MLFPSVGRNGMKYSPISQAAGGRGAKTAHIHSQLNTSLCNRAQGDEPTLNVATLCNDCSYQEFILGALLMFVDDGIHSQHMHEGLPLWLIFMYENNVCAAACASPVYMQMGAIADACLYSADCNTMDKQNL